VKAKKRARYEVLKKKGKVATVVGGLEKVGKRFGETDLSDMFISPRKGKKRTEYDMIGSLGGSSDIIGDFGVPRKRKRRKRRKKKKR